MFFIFLTFIYPSRPFTALTNLCGNSTWIYIFYSFPEPLQKLQGRLLSKCLPVPLQFLQVSVFFDFFPTFALLIFLVCSNDFALCFVIASNGRFSIITSHSDGRWNDSSRMSRSSESNWGIICSSFTSKLIVR